MIKRKVVQHGPSTLIVSLPSRWVKKYNVQKGSELEVIEEDNNLVVGTDISPKLMEVDINITGLDRTSIMYAIRSLYRSGYDKVNVTFENQVTEYQRIKNNLNVLSVIHTEVNRLVGYEIIKEREKSCVIMDLQETSTKDFDQVLRRIFLLLKDTYQDFLEGIKTNDIISLETIENKHDTITKFVSYCLRMLNKKGYTQLKKTSYYYHIIAYLDRITDIIKYSARDARNYKKKLNPQIIDILEIICHDLNSFYELFYKFDNHKIFEINTNRYKVEKVLRQLPPNIKTTEMVIVVSQFQILEILLDLIEARTALEY